jgi:hypothetical protein
MSKKCVICGTEENKEQLAHIMSTNQRVCQKCSTEKPMLEVYKAAIKHERGHSSKHHQAHAEIEDRR